MKFREACTADIPAIQRVRHLVQENKLSDPSLVTNQDCEDFINYRGKGWVCEMLGKVVGFAIADLKENNIWALFVEPGFDRRGIGRQLHKLMLDWYFASTGEPVWLGTEPGTRAESFYRKAGWTEIGTHGKGETKFSMRKKDWLKEG